MVRTFFFLFSLIFASVINAQSVKIYGKVTDSISGPVPGSTVMLIGQQDSILKSFAIADKEGNFILKNVKPDAYLFKINFYGYQPYEETVVFTENSSDTAFGTITLLPKLLNVITVDADYIPIQIKGDTIEYDSRAFETGAHDVVENLLEQLPGVEVQSDGSIRVKGKTVQKILVDGEEFFGNDPTIATKNLPADAIEKVQVFDKESDAAAFTGIEDGNEATTINLKLKEDRKKGYFGNLDIAYGDQNRYKAKGNLNYFKNKWQISGVGLANNVNETGFSINDYISFVGGIQNLANGSASLNLDGNQGLPISNGQESGFLTTNALGLNINYKLSEKGTLSSNIFSNVFNKTFDREIDRTTYFQDSSLFSEERTLQNSNTFNNRGNIHYKQEIDSTQFLDVDLSGQWTLANYDNVNDLSNLNPLRELRNQYTTKLDQKNVNYHLNASTEYRKKFKKKRRYTGGGISYAFDNRGITSGLSYENIAYTPTPISALISQNQLDDRTNGDLSINWLFSEPISKKHLLQFSVSHVRRNEARNKEVNDVLSPDDLTFNPFFSGNATYGNYSNEGQFIHKFLSKKLKTTVGTGLNQLVLFSEDFFEANPRFNYVLPFFRLNWDVSQSADLRLNYGTRTNAPQLTQLQSIPDNTNPAEIVLGNTALTPEYIHDLSLEYNLFNQFNFLHLLARISVTRTENKINYSQFIDPGLNRIFTPENNGREDRLSSFISFGSNINPLKIKFDITNNTTVSQGQLTLNGIENSYTSFVNNVRFTVENTKKKVINAKLGVGGNYTNSVYSENEAFNNDVFSWNYLAGLTVKLKDKWELKSDVNHFFYPDFEANSQQVIINASIARNLLKSKKLQVYLAANDLLNQNTGINQAYYLNYFEQERTATLARYFLLGVKFSFNKLAGK